jgi:hypothetical protein
MKNQKSPEELYEYLKNHKGYEVARASFLRQLEWEGNKPLENAMANSYAMLMVANGGNKEEAVQFILKVYKPENLAKLLKVAASNQEPSVELVNEILN